MSETRKIAAILVSDVVGYSRLAGADEDRTLARLRALRSDLIDPTISVHHGRIVKRTGDGSDRRVSQRRRRGALRARTAARHGRAQRGRRARQAHRISHRHSFGRRRRGERRRSDGRRRQHRRAAGGDRRARHDLPVRGRLPPSKPQARYAVTDLGPTQLKNIERSIRVYSLRVGVPAQAKPATKAKAAEPKRRSSVAPLALGMAALVLLVAGGGFGISSGANRVTLATAPAPALVAATPAPAKPAHLFIVVLPFTNLSGDPAQDYFADGITENLTTDVSRFRDSFVIARNTAFTYKGKSVDAKEIGKELGVRYVLEGSVQRDQNRVRVNAQLIDAETGAHIWADRFEEDLADLFKLQDQVVARLANALNYELVRADAETAARSKNPDLIDLDMPAPKRFGAFSSNQRRTA